MSREAPHIHNFERSFWRSTIQIYHYISQLNVLVILFDLVILMFPEQEAPKAVCILFEWLTSCIMMQRCHGDLSIALGRYAGSVMI